MKNKVRIYRKGQGVTQAALAAHLKVSRQTICAIEQGKYNPGLELAFALAMAFHTSVEDLFHYEHPGEAAEADSPLQSPKAIG
ncbi:helix-turn-helix transcriptional regulator [Candidatus Woesearchaeota archaeon]|nr:helix-turn-helix transcriptional regulator [Candidatus Woesearchaeota archaeon]